VEQEANTKYLSKLLINWKINYLEQEINKPSYIKLYWYLIEYDL